MGNAWEEKANLEALAALRDAAEPGISDAEKLRRVQDAGRLAPPGQQSQERIYQYGQDGGPDRLDGGQWRG